MPQKRKEVRGKNRQKKKENVTLSRKKRKKRDKINAEMR
jgi:hypothetical protein